MTAASATDRPHLGRCPRRDDREARQAGAPSRGDTGTPGAAAGAPGERTTTRISAGPASGPAGPARLWGRVPIRYPWP